MTILNKVKDKCSQYFLRFTNPFQYLIYRRFNAYTIIPEHIYLKNLRLCQRYNRIPGAVVECGTWKGGMIAGIASLLGNERDYYLFDSFEGLPQAKEIDGSRALSWQSDRQSQFYFDNCRADEKDAHEAMKLAGCDSYQVIKGWFHETLPLYKPSQIAILRLDADWYGSIMVCLEELADRVVPGGIIIMDDYYVFDGCSKAVHDFLSRKNTTGRVAQYRDTVMYIEKV